MIAAAIYTIKDELQKKLTRPIYVPAKFLTLIVFFIILNIIDIVSTLKVIKIAGAEVEFNQLMRLLLNQSPEAFVFCKLFVLFFAVAYYLSKSNITKQDYALFVVFNMIYSVVTINNLCGYYIVFMI